MVTNQRSRRPDMLINLLIGASDGFIVPSALMAAMTAAGSAQHQIVRMVAIVTALAALIMGIGGYLTRKNAELQPKNFVRDELNLVEQDKTRAFFANLGMSEEMQEQAVSEMKKDDLEWKNFIERYDLDPSTQSPGISGFIIGLSYALAGTLALLPFIIQPDTSSSFYISIAISLPLLFVLGVLKGRLTGSSGWINGLKLLLTGALAIAAAYTAVSIFYRH
ncbi:MAG: hypothetical protein EOO05_00430 [Chitinophagaceae bacterium]|nr:MAG: hypothetical protein EOO05_00430 [Chitinophagaceae bacterium]